MTLGEAENIKLVMSYLFVIFIHFFGGRLCHFVYLSCPVGGVYIH